MGPERGKRSATATGSTILPERWFLERTFGWVRRARRLVFPLSVHDFSDRLQIIQRDGAQQRG